MNPLVRNLFHELVDLPHEEREKVLAEQGISPEVRAEVESLLDFDSPDDPTTDTHWGPYRRIGVLGTGGMGTVYLAERADGEIQQRVAIKFLRTDIHRPAWRDRFLKERQLLSYLNHPSIARLFDAGHTKDGRPYLVMEYVDGVPIDEYTATMDLHGRLSLFLQVCDGVSHAHHRLIIHRDLKPSNILVDGSGQPKLLDFGLAKLLDDTKNQTKTIDRLLTPSYASPEQFQGAAESTATDVYSLGAVLHKILLGHTPNEEAPGPKPDLPGDLQYILRKALRTEPEERYVSVEAFANDIQAFLDWRPVEARSGDRWYRTRKFVRRYRVPVGATVLVVAALVAGLYGVNRERRTAQRRFEQVRQLSNKVLALDSVIRLLPGATKARNEIVAMSKEYLEGLVKEGPPDEDLAMELSSAFVKLAEVQGVPTATNLGQYDQAELSLSKADELVESALKTSPREPKALVLSAQINEDRMILADANHHREAMPGFARKTADRLETLSALGKMTDDQRISASRMLSNVALAHKNLHLYPESVRYGRRAIDILGSARNSQPLMASALSVIADALRSSGDLQGALQAISQARATIENYKFADEAPRVSTLNNILWRQGVILGADGQISLMRPDEAIIVLQQAYDLIDEAASKDPDDASHRILFVQAGSELGNILRDRNPERALAVFDHALLRLSEVKNNTKARRGEAKLLAASSYVLRRLNRMDQAQPRVDKALDLLRQTKDYPAKEISIDDETVFVLLALGDQLAETGRFQQAGDVYRELLDTLMASHPDPENDLRHAATLSRIYESLTRLHARNGKPDEAKSVSAQRLKIWQTWNRKLPNSTFIQQELASASSAS